MACPRWHTIKIFRCPRCHEGKLYKSLLSVVDSCSKCNLPLKEHEQGDGPAFFAIVLIGGLAGILAAVVEIKYEPPYWLHAVLWLPFIIVGSLLAIRLFKAMLIAAQYQWRKDDFTP